MNTKRIWAKITVVLVCLGILAEVGYAIMPPEVYKKYILESKLKAVATVRNVEIIEKTEYYIEKKVEFELMCSYGEILPPKVFYGYCKSATENLRVGGTIYYYPMIGDEVFVTIGSIGEGEDTGNITSFTYMDEDIKKALRDDGFAGLNYGMGKVYPK